MNNKKVLKLLCIFSGGREAALEAARSGEGPKTVFFGFYPFLVGADSEIAASILPREDYPRPASFLRYRKRVRDVDIVIASYLSWLLVVGKIFFPRKKFILYNIDLNSVISRASALRRTLLRLKLAFVDKIVCITYRQEEVLAALGVSKRKLHFLHFGIDRSFFEREMKKHSGVSPEIFFAVGADEARDYKTLLLAAAELPDLRFLIECKEKNIPKDVPVPGNVQLLPMIPGKMQELTERYANARVIVIPSLDEARNVGSDCCGQTVLLEALACGKPVVVSERTWIRDYFSPTDPILIFEAENARALVALLKQTDFSSVVRPDFILQHTSDAMTDGWRTFFHELVSA